MTQLNLVTQALILLICSVFSFGIGFLLRRSATNNLRNKVLYLETDMLANHAEILKLESTLTELNAQTSSEKSTPIVSLPSSHSQQKQAR